MGIHASPLKLVQVNREMLATDVLGVQISAVNMTTAVQTIESWIEGDANEYVCICSVHSIIEADHDPSFKEILNRAGMRCPDGMPLVWLSRQAGHRKITRVAGPDLLPALSARSQETGHSHYFYGGHEGVAADLVESLTKTYPAMKIAGFQTPALLATGERDSERVIDQINDACPDIVWVGLGCPKQEWWMSEHRPLLNAKVLIGVGAAFDFHSGRLRRAPNWMQRSGTEWLFRLIQNPRRLGRRYLTTNVGFAAKIVSRWSKKSNGE